MHFRGYIKQELASQIFKGFYYTPRIMQLSRLIGNSAYRSHGLLHEIMDEAFHEVYSLKCKDFFDADCGYGNFFHFYKSVFCCELLFITFV